jgi:uncharacterized cupredoxin-like copper-binding protein
MRRLRHPRAVLLLLPWLAGCASGLHRPIVTAEPRPDAAGIQRVVVSMHSYYFEPSRIVVHAGQPVELVLKNRAKLIPHNFTIADPSLQMSERAWLRTGHITFTPQKPGTYAFFCKVDHHANKGMTGELVVVP